MKRLKRLFVLSLLTVSVVFTTGVNNANAASKLTPEHLYTWAKDNDTARLNKYKHYINIENQDKNTALCLAQQDKNRDAYALLLQFGASTKVPCHDDNDPVCAMIVGEKIKVSPAGMALIGVGAAAGAYALLHDDDKGCDKSKYPLDECPEHGQCSHCKGKNRLESCDEFWTPNADKTACIPVDCPTGEQTSCEDKPEHITTATPTANKSGDQQCYQCSYTCNEKDNRYDNLGFCAANHPGIVCELNENQCWYPARCDTAKGYYDTDNECRSSTPGYTCKIVSNGCYMKDVCDIANGHHPNQASCENANIGYHCVQQENLCWLPNFTLFTECLPNSHTALCETQTGIISTPTPTGKSGPDDCLECDYQCDTAAGWQQGSAAANCHAGRVCSDVSINDINRSKTLICYRDEGCPEDHPFTTLAKCEEGGYVCKESASGSQCWRHSGNQDCPDTHPYRNQCQTGTGFTNGQTETPVGDAPCYNCNYQCDTANGWQTTCQAGRTCSDITMPNGIKCYNNTTSSCPPNYPYTELAKCEEGGYVCEESAPGSKCWKHNGNQDCPDTHPYRTQCQTGTGYTNGQTQTPVGDAPCYNCNYQCDTANSWYSACPTGKTCSNITMPNGTPCYHPTGCDTTHGYYDNTTSCQNANPEHICTVDSTGCFVVGACDAAHGYYATDVACTTANPSYTCTKTAHNCYIKNDPAACPPPSHINQCLIVAGIKTTPTVVAKSGENDCYDCTYICDTANGWQPGTASSCPTGWLCQYASVTDPYRSKGADCYKKDKCDPMQGYYDNNSACTTANPEYTCLVDITGCYTKNICDTTKGYYATKALCEQAPANIGYQCTQSTGGCWTKNTAPTPCTPPSNIAQCLIDSTNGILTTPTVTGQSGTSDCYDCDYSCNTTAGWKQGTKAANCPAGKECSETSINDTYRGKSITCYRDNGCPTDYPYTSLADCQNGGYACVESATGSGCWKHNGSENCPSTHPYETPCTDAKTGITLIPHTPLTVGGRLCYKCEYECNSSLNYKDDSDISICGTTVDNGWKFINRVDQGDASCAQCEEKDCPTGTAISISKCSAPSPLVAELGASTTSYHGNAPCYTCEYKCDENDNYFALESQCVAGGTYTCKSTTATVNSKPYTCWYREGDFHCPPGEQKDHCSTGTGYKTTETEKPYEGGTCYVCAYSCDTANGWQAGSTCPAGKTCPNGTNKITSPVACIKPICPADYTFTSEATCKAGGYTCVESATGSGCWKRNGSGNCPSTHPNESPCATPTKEGITLSQDSITSGGRPCYSCTYSCDTAKGWKSGICPVDAYHIGTCNTEQGITCGKITGCNTTSGYKDTSNIKNCGTSGSNGWEFITPNHTQDGVSCAQCQKTPCDPGSATTASNCEKHTSLVAHLGSSSTSYYGDTECYACEYSCDEDNNFFSSKNQCTNNGAYECFEVTYLAGHTCWERGDPQCPSSHPYESPCTAAPTGTTLTQGGPLTVGSKKCYSCSYACNGTTHFATQSSCETASSNAGYTCTTTNITTAVGTKTCWIKSSTTQPCPTNSHTAQCLKDTNITTTPSNEGKSGTETCYSCQYSCNSGWTVGTCPAGRSCSTASINDTYRHITLSCYKDNGCPADYPYTSEANCKAGGYTCVESATGSGCWKHSGSGNCPSTHPYESSCTAATTGIKLTQDGPIPVGDKNCYSCTYTCDTTNGYKDTTSIYNCGTSGTNGWKFIAPYQTQGGVSCARCQRTPCPTGSATTEVNCAAYTGLTVKLGTSSTGYYGDTECYACEYSCDEANKYYDNESQCTQGGYTCTETTINGKKCWKQGEKTFTCPPNFVPMDKGDVNTSYFNRNIFTNPLCNEATQTHCEKCIRVTGCTTETYSDSDTCKENYETCTAHYNSYDSNIVCWTGSGSLECPSTHPYESPCTAATTGIKLTQGGPLTVGSKQCYSCTYACDTTAGYKDTSDIKNCGTSGSNGWEFITPYHTQGGVSCAQCQKTPCDPGSATTAGNCEKHTSLVAHLGSSSTSYYGDTECYACEYSCDEDNKYYANEAECSQGGSYSCKESTVNGITCYLQGDPVTTCNTSCRDDYPYITFLSQENTGETDSSGKPCVRCSYNCKSDVGYYGNQDSCQSATGTECVSKPVSYTLNNNDAVTLGCWILGGNITPCPEGYDTTIQSVDNCGTTKGKGWTYTSSGISNGKTCGKCTAKTCSSGSILYISSSRCNITQKGFKATSTTAITDVYAGDDQCYKCNYGCDNKDGFELPQMMTNSGWSFTQTTYEDAICFVRSGCTPCPLGYTQNCYSCSPTSGSNMCPLPGDTPIIDDDIKVLADKPVTEFTYTYHSTSVNTCAATEYPNVVRCGKCTDDGVSSLSTTPEIQNTIYGVRGTSDEPLVNAKDDTLTLQNFANTTAIGMFSDQSQTVINQGRISIINDIDSQNSTAIGIHAGLGVEAINEGVIQIEGQDGTAIGILGEGANHIVNAESGIIDVTGAKAYGIYVKDGDGALVENKGVIKAQGEEAHGIYIEKNANVDTVLNSGSIYINGTEKGNAGITLNGADLRNESLLSFSGKADLDMLDGRVYLEKGGTIEAQALEGDLTLGVSNVLGTNENTYIAEGALQADDLTNLNLISESALFSAKATTDGKTVMEREDFANFAPNASIAKYLNTSYEQGKLVEMYDAIKRESENEGARQALAKKLGYDTLPNFADENFMALKSLNRNIADTILTPSDENYRVVAGADSVSLETKNKSVLSGYDLSASSMYTFGDKRLDNKNRLGLGISFTDLSSSYDHGGSRDLKVVSLFVPYLHKFSEKLNLASILSLGYGYGHLERGGNKDADIKDIFYGFTNELRYTVDLNGFASLEPALYLNAIGYSEDGLDEGSSELALETDRTHNLSVEAGIGLFLKKQVSLEKYGKLGFKIGGAYYRELGSPYNDIKARLKGSNGGWYKVNDYANIYTHDRALLEAAIDYEYKDLSIYAKFNQILQKNNPKLFDLGVKYKF